MNSSELTSLTLLDVCIHKVTDLCVSIAACRKFHQNGVHSKHADDVCYPLTMLITARNEVGAR